MLGVALSFTAPYLSLFGVEQAGMSPMRLGAFMTLVSASGVFASTAVGRWSDRTQRHRAPLVASLVAAALGFASLGFLRGYPELMVVGGLLLGPGAASLSQIFSFGHAVLRIDDPAQDEFAAAALRTLLSVAWVFGPAIGALILAQAGFTGLFAFAAASFAASAVITLRMSETRAESVEARNDEEPERSSVTRNEAFVEYGAGDISVAQVQPASDAAVVERGRKTIPRLLLALTLIGLAANATMILLPLYMVHELHGTRLTVSAALGAGALLEIPMMLWLGAISSRLHKPSWLTASAAVHAVYFVALALLGEPQMIVPLQILPAAVVAITSCLGMTHVQDLMPGETGAATALFFNASRVGSILSGVLSGAIVSAFGYRVAFLLCAGLAVCAFVLLSVDTFRSRR
ncbi:sugar efflux transporter [Trinickia soli]|uniref:MFS transporter n=1 Tax=Trinickia soli TaxID=380675 RepID=A0A2N7VM76_9BURK|nr:MFS transporter [Paraburkholderia sp. T12-10]PMS18258.1 MFS transporter [Trinickia soli]